jgi:hypothetical protein
MPKADTAALDADPKLKAFNEIVASISTLSAAEQYAVLHAAAKYFNVSIKLET